MDDGQLAPVGGLVDRLAADLDPAEIEAGERLDHLVVIAGDIDDAGAALRALQHAPDDVIMLGRPEMPFLEAPAVDDVADQIERLAIDIDRKSVVSGKSVSVRLKFVGARIL